PWVHTCAAGTPLPLLVTSGARGISVDLGLMTAADHDALAQALDDGQSVALGVVPSLDPATAPNDVEVTERVLRWLDMLGLDPAEVGERLVLTPTCGLAGASPSWTRQALALLRTSAANLSG
ncbi:methionine synthase, partial [Nocardioides hankookensis]